MGVFPRPSDSKLREGLLLLGVNVIEAGFGHSVAYLREPDTTTARTRTIVCNIHLRHHLLDPAITLNPPSGVALFAGVEHSGPFEEHEMAEALTLEFRVEGHGASSGALTGATRGGVAGFDRGAADGFLDATIAFKEPHRVLVGWATLDVGELEGGELIELEAGLHLAWHHKVIGVAGSLR